MSILARIYPAAGLHRYVASRADLRAEAARLERENEDLACQLVRTTKALATATVDLDAAAIRWSGIALARDAAEETAGHLAGEMALLVDELHAVRAELANRTRIDVPPMHRDIDDGDTSTQPIPAGQHRADPTAWRATTSGSRVVSLPDAVDQHTGEIPRPNAA